MTTVATQQTIGIVGAGIIGVQLARALQRRGTKVTLFDKGDPGMATSFGNAGYLATDEIFPLAHGAVLRSLPRMLLNPLGPLALRWKEFPRLLPWYIKYARACSSHRAAHSIKALASIQGRAVTAWQQVINREHLGPLIVANGAMTVFETDRGFADTRVRREVQREYGVSWEVLSGAAAAEQIPELSSAIRHAVIYPAGMHVVDPYTVTTTILANFLSDGGEFIQAEVVTVDDKSGRVRVVGDEYLFDSVVVCCGHRSGRLLKSLHYKVPIIAERGYHVEMSHRETRLNMPVGAYERGFYVTPMTSGLRLAGTSEFSSADHDEDPTWGRAEILKQHIGDIMPGLAREETSRWMGHRPTMPDFLPVLGRAPGSAKLYLAFGHHHLGLTLSAITAEVMTDLIVTGTPPFDIEAFDLGRFQ